MFIELTERGLLEQNAKERIEELRALGVRIAIDDFGTGYSSLAYLASFSLDYLKLDKLFTQGIADKGPRRTVAIQIVELARSLDLDVIAEGVETIERAMAVSTHGVAKAQGWLYGARCRWMSCRLPEGLRPPPRARSPSRGKCPPVRSGGGRLWPPCSGGCAGAMAGTRMLASVGGTSRAGADDEWRDDPG